MLIRNLPTVAVLALAIALMGADRARAGNLLRWLTGHRPEHAQPVPTVVPPHVVPPPAAAIPHHVAAPPGPHRYAEYNAAGNAAWYGYGFGVPTYDWGYFGARYRPAVVTHRGYYDDLTQWGYRRGY